MQIFAYPGDRVDFVSKTASAGALEFGDPIGLIEEFFGPAHTKTAAAEDSGHQTLTYYNGSLAFDFSVGKLEAITIEPALSREKIEIFVDRERVSGPASEAAIGHASQAGVEATYGESLEKIRLTRIS